MPRTRISDRSRIRTLIRSAYRRRLLVLGVEQLALTLAALFGAATLLLLLGTQIVNWYWLVILGVVGTAIAVVRLRRRLVPEYRVAQILDQRLELSDSLSTACFLLSQENRRDEPMAHLQVERAAADAAAIEVSRAFPFTGQRTWALTVALAAVMFGLFAVRYLTTSTLSFERALIPIHLAEVLERVRNSLSLQSNGEQRSSRLDQQEKDLQRAGGRQADARSGAEQGTQLNAGKSDRVGEGQVQQQSENSQPTNNPRTGQSAGSPSAAGAQKTAAEKAAESAGNQPPSAEKASEQSPSGQPGSSGLLDKMKDALSSLVAKMRPDPNPQKQAPNGQRTPDDQKSGDEAASKAQRNQPDGRKQEANQDHSAESQAQGQTTERAQSGQGRNSDQSPEKGSDAHSGIGRQDGDKEVKEADQLRAMGKLAEIIGKRSASVTGEMMVETGSGKQQLKTDYSQRLGHHSDLGGEINRDEIPLADQQYIREYMELVRNPETEPRPSGEGRYPRGHNPN